MAETIIDAWIQHPTGKFIAHEMFASLRRWMRLEVIPDEIPVELTLAALDGAGVSKAIASAWWGPDGPLLSNDEVAQTVRAHPRRFVGVVGEQHTTASIQQDSRLEALIGHHDLHFRRVILKIHEADIQRAQL